MINKKNKNLILIVDDMKENLRLLGNLLQREGYSVAVSDSGKKAISGAILAIPDLILLDIGLPDLDGYEVCRELKKHKETFDIPVIFLTGKNDFDDILNGFKAGGVDYITKPFNQHELLARVKTHIDLKLAREKIEKLSLYDELAGIPNKRYFNIFFEQEWKRSVRDKYPLSVIMIDIDLFKVYNDSHGHIEGDRCLAEIAHLLENSVERPSDFVARFGGEEFVAVLPNTNLEGAKLIAEKMRKSIEDRKIKRLKSNDSDYITISLGVASIHPEEDTDIIGFINDVDNALYKSKENGRNTISVVMSG